MSGPIRDLKVEYVAPTSLTPQERNARTHNRRQRRQIAKSIRTFGWTNPILVDAEDRVLAGHGRLQVAIKMELETVPVIRIEGLSQDQIRAYVLADNKIAQNAGWDDELLALELGALLEIDDLEFDITVSGFEIGEIDQLVLGDELEAETQADSLPAPDPDAPIVTRRGDLWLLGKHRLLCGDATSSEAFSRLMDGEPAQMAFTDPPYNVKIDGNVSGLGRAKHAEFTMASGEMTTAEFIDFLKRSIALMAAHTANGSIHFICMDWRHIVELQAAGADIYSELKNICVWTKTNAGMGSLYRSAHEFVLVYKKGKAKHINNIDLGRYGRNRTNVWSYPGMNAFGPERAQLLASHPTVKPVAMVQDAILDCSDRKGIVLDPFAGSGTTFIAAERCGRRCYGLEIDPVFCDLILRRYRDNTGTEPTHDVSGKTFSTCEARSRGSCGDEDEAHHG